MNKIIEKLLEEVDPDIKEIMLCDSNVYSANGVWYKYWELVGSPLLIVLEWQALRDRKNKLLKE